MKEDPLHPTSIVLAISTVLLLAACGSGGEGSDPVGSGPDTPVSSSPDPSPTGPIKNGAQRVEPKPGMVEVRPSAFEKAKVLDDRTLRIFFYQGVAPCSVLDRVDVEYGTETIGVTLQVGHQETEEDTACIELAVYNYVDVQLNESVAGRKIVDDAR